MEFENFRSERIGAYCIVKAPASILARGSEFSLNLLKISLTCFLTSARMASSWSSSTEAASGTPRGQEVSRA